MMDTGRIKRAADELERNKVALGWLEEYGAQFTGRDRDEASFRVELFRASACPGAKEAQEIINSYARLSLPELIKTATESCRNTIEICAATIREEAAPSRSPTPTGD